MAPLAKCWSALAALVGTTHDNSINRPSTSSLQSVLGETKPVLAYFDHSENLPNTKSAREFRWSDITPSPQFQFHPCFNGFHCARLQVPMDWNSTAEEPETVALAVIKLPAKVSVTDPRYGGPVLINPGGPGGSGVSTALNRAKPMQAIVDAGYYDDEEDHLDPKESARYYDILSWDPRAVNNTTPFQTCFTQAGDLAAWQASSDAVLGTPEGDLDTLWARSLAYGANCAYDAKTHPNGSRIASFTTTAMVVRDMVEILEQHAEWREQQAKVEMAHRTSRFPVGKGDEEKVLARTRRIAGEEPLHYWGFSYGTVLGATFAAMQPHRAHRMVLDGVADAEDYYHTGWTKNLQDTDKIMDLFFESCYAAGEEGCKLFTGDSAADIKVAWDSVEERIRMDGPIPVPATELRGPEIITVSDLKQYLWQNLYKPLFSFERMAAAIGALALHDNASALADWKHERHLGFKQPLCDHIDPFKPECGLQSFNEAGRSILCAEGDEDVFRNISKAQFSEYWAELRNQSRYLGDAWAGIRLQCAGWRVEGKWKFEGPLASNATAHPILWVGNTLDNVTPLRNAIKSATRYEGSVALQVDVEGHCSTVNPSLCTGKAIRAYFQEGKLPEKGTVCLPHRRPLTGTKGPRIEPLPATLSKDQELILVAQEYMMNGTSW